MTPKEKAKELFDKYFVICQEFTEEIQCSIQAKQCALVTVDEIINSKHAWNKTKSVFVNYWQEVKQEIINLNELAEKHPNYTGFFIRKVSSKTNPECKCVGVGYCYAEDKDNNIVRPCELNKTFKSE